MHETEQAQTNGIMALYKFRIIIIIITETAHNQAKMNMRDTKMHFSYNQCFVQN